MCNRNIDTIWQNLVTVFFLAQREQPKVVCAYDIKAA